MAMWGKPKSSKIIVTLKLKKTAELINRLDRTSELYNGYMNILTAMFYLVYIELIGKASNTKALKQCIHNIKCSNGVLLQDFIFENEVIYESVELMIDEVGPGNLSEMDVDDPAVKSLTRFLDKFTDAISQTLSQDLELPDQKTHEVLRSLAGMHNTMYIETLDSRTVAIIYKMH